MNLPIPPRAATALLVAGFVVSISSDAFARVGETQDAVERRILQPNLGKLYFPPRSKDPKEAKEIERQLVKDERDQPFNDVKEFFPENREGVYWKSAMANQLSNEDGWKVHVFYVGGRSALEAYKRVGEALNEFEIRALLSVNKGSSSWKKTGGSEGIGHEYELEDGSLRASVRGNWLMFFAPRLDGYVIEQQKVAKDLKDKELARQKIEQQAKAPESVTGF